METLEFHITKNGSLEDTTYKDAIVCTYVENEINWWLFKNKFAQVEQYVDARDGIWDYVVILLVFVAGCGIGFFVHKNFYILTILFVGFLFLMQCKLDTEKYERERQTLVTAFNKLGEEDVQLEYVDGTLFVSFIPNPPSYTVVNVIPDLKDENQ